MQTQPAPVGVTPALAPSDLDRVRDLYHQGLCLQAFRLAESLAPLPSWRGPAARVLAGRVAIHVGGTRLCYLMHLRAWREDRNHPEATYYYARGLLERRGPLAAWRFLRQRGEELGGDDVALKADWLAFHGCVLGRLRDFDAAERWLDRAEQTCPGRPWTQIERAALLEWEDRYDESLAAAQKALELRPWYRPGVQCVAHTLQLLGRDREALELLAEGAARIESVMLLGQLGALQTELGQHGDARATYARFHEMAPLLEKDFATWLAARRSDAAYYIGDYAEAQTLARTAGGPLYDSIAETLARPDFTPRRVLLDVGFVRQHRQTCVPATLAALSRFWGRPTEHLDIAAAICYDGTPDHRERAWAEECGYVCREFTVTWDAARALLDRGVPFTFTTAEPGSAHLQAVIGYDTCRQSLLVRDPYQPHFVEYHAEATLERYRSVGPRGHAFVPKERAELLDGLDLPDAALYDRVYHLQRALHQHDRAAAAAEYDALRAAAPDHRLAWQAQRVLAAYDADPAGLLASAEGLLTLFPDDPLHTLCKVWSVRDLGRREERLALLQTACLRRDVGPTFLRLYAQELLPDAREHPAAIRALQRAIRINPYDEGNFSTLATLLWSQRRFEEALELYGFAACLGDKNETLARDYFLAARFLQRTEETLRFLRRRFERFGAHSGQPARTLYWAYEAFERLPEALALLDEALALRPDDGELLLFAVHCYVPNGDFDRAAERLRAAEGRAPRAAWLRAAAGLARARGDLAGAKALWRQVADAEPMALDAAEALALLLGETEGRPAALAYLQEICDRFPHNFSLHQLWSGWAQGDGVAAEEPVVRRIVAIHPADAWARRELALVLAHQNRLPEAFAELEVAGRLEPHSSSYHCVLAQVCQRAGRREEARAAYREAIRLSVDNDYAVGSLIDSCDTMAERLEDIRFIAEELERQVIYGDGLLAFARVARRSLTAPQLLAHLRKAHASRPDLWHAWSALIVQLTETGESEEARTLARQATERFPLLAPLWLDLATACALCADGEGERDALQKAVQVRPGWMPARRRLAESLMRDGKAAEARPHLERAVAQAPLDTLNHGWLAHALWQCGDKEAALASLRTALALDPGYDWAWASLRSWSTEMDQKDLTLTMARDLAARRPHEARSWLRLADSLEADDAFEERLSALERAASLNPQLVEAYDLRAAHLAHARRYDEAEAACRPAAFNGSPPLLLRGRLAWVKAQRGDLSGAIATMQAALKEDPDYYWGWSNLVDWLRDISTDEYRAAADQLVRLAPRHAISYGYRGEAKARQGDRTGAKEDYRRAIEIDPSYGFAGLALFDEHYQDGEWDEAEKTLRTLKENNIDDDFVAAREAQLAARRGDRSAALKAFERLAASLESATWPLEAAAAALGEEASWSAEVDQTLEAATAAATPSPHAPRLWVRRKTERGAWEEVLARAVALPAENPAALSALSEYLHLLGRQREGRRLRDCLTAHRERLRSATATWGAVGFALATLEDNKAAAAWLSDWEKRENMQPWMLINLVIALRALGDDAAAARAGRRALELPPDHTSGHHQVWLALDVALAGRPDEARASLAALNRQERDNTHRFLWALIEALAAAKEEGGSAARRRLRQAAGECAPLVEDRAAVTRMYRRTVTQLARETGGVAAALWATWRRLFPLLPPLKSA